MHILMESKYVRFAFAIGREDSDEEHEHVHLGGNFEPAREPASDEGCDCGECDRLQFGFRHG